MEVKNKVLEIYQNLPHDILMEAMEDIIEWNKTGSLGDGVVRNICNTHREITEQSISEVLWITQFNILHEIGKRWYSENKEPKRVYAITAPEGVVEILFSLDETENKMTEYISNHPNSTFWIDVIEK